MTWLAKPTCAQTSSDGASEMVADCFIESYVLWREACEDVRGAYGRWRKCKPAQCGVQPWRVLNAECCLAVPASATFSKDC
jgi:hypothetical protein